MKLVINDPIIKSYRPNVSDWVKLTAITWEQLCHQTYNPTAYLRQNGPDAQSLKVISPNQNKDLLLIRYDADKKVATVFINWSLYEMHQAVQQMLICISGNHDVDIEVRMQVVHPKKSPNIQLVNKTASCIWGTTNVANLIVRGTVDGGHDSWKYSCLTKVFIEKVDGFYISGQREEIYDGKKGYIIKLNQWEQKSIAIKYDYARGFINNDLQRKLPLYFIYYTVNRVGFQNVNRHVIDEFVVTFTPLQPIIAVKMKRLQKEYVIGTTDVNLFEVTLTKQDGHAQNIEGLSLISQDTRININKVNDSYLVSLNALSFKDLPSSNVEIELKATARNANSVSEYIVLSTGRLDNDRSILLKRKRLIDIKDNSEIKNNGRVILYKGNSPTQYLLYLRNISSSVLGTGLTLNNIKIEVRSDLGISFSNGRTRENIARLQDGSFSTLKINVHPYSVPSIKDVSIVVTSDFSEPLILTAKVETKDKINPQICFGFEKEVDLYSVDSKDFKPIQYNNLQIGTLFIKTEEIPDDQLNNYKSYSFQDHSIEIIDNEKISLKSTSQGTILKPGDILRIGVLLTGDVSTGEHFIVKSGCNEKIITLPVTKKIYNLPIVDFSPANGDCIFEYCEKERLYIGEFIPQFQESANNDDVDCVMNISKPFCFENGSFEIPITKTSSPVKLYFLLSEEFGGVKNICNNKSYPLILSLLSPVFCEKKEANYGNIIINLSSG